MDLLTGAKFFSKINLYSDYHQLHIKDSDIYKTAFRTRYGYYEFLVMPFRLINTSATFMILMNNIFQKVLDKFIIIYLNNILVYSKNCTEYVKHLKFVLSTLHNNHLYIKWIKYELFKNKVKYLDHYISADGIAMDKHKIETIKDWSMLTNESEV